MRPVRVVTMGDITALPTEVPPELQLVLSNTGVLPWCTIQPLFPGCPEAIKELLKPSAPVIPPTPPATQPPVQPPYLPPYAPVEPPKEKGFTLSSLTEPENLPYTLLAAAIVFGAVVFMKRKGAR
jgi:hypothetical protein